MSSAPNWDRVNQVFQEVLEQEKIAVAIKAAGDCAKRP
jgi:hypothetical protein